MSKERPILFSAPMVRAILEGRKTQTRRVVKSSMLGAEPFYTTGKVIHDLPRQPGSWLEYRHRRQDEPGFDGSQASYLLRSKYGDVGDRLWVRETWYQAFKRTETSPGCVYRADDNGRDLNPGWSPNGNGGGWRPSIHMPRWASRITLEITGVRVERLQDISEADAAAEGVAFSPYAWSEHEAPKNNVDSFECLWTAINGAESWAANPWCWVIEFKRVTA